MKEIQSKTFLLDERRNDLAIGSREFSFLI